MRSGYQRRRIPPAHSAPITPLATRCCEWYGPTRTGYGVRKIPGRRSPVLVHRWVMEQVHGPLSADTEVMHLCDNRACFRYDHLAIGNNRLNRDDMMAKNRSPFGERSGTAKLTWPQVREIRQRSANGEQGKTIASDFGVSRATVSLIINGRIWVERSVV